MKHFSGTPESPHRRKFLTQASILPFLIHGSISSVLAKWNTPSFPWLTEKYEEYQEDFLLSLPSHTQTELLENIRRNNPKLVQFFMEKSDFPLWKGHLLRVGYTELTLQKELPKPRHLQYQKDESLRSENIFSVIDAIKMRPGLPGAFWHQAKLPLWLSQISPFDIIPAEQRTVNINGTYGAFDGGNCIEHTWNGRETGRILTLKHGDIIEFPPGVIHAEAGNIDGFSIPKPSINPKTGITLCSQTAYFVGKKLGLEIPRGGSAFESLKLYKKTAPRWETFTHIPLHIRFVDIFMRSKNHPNHGHRAIWFRYNNTWNIIDPYSHNEIVTPLEYKRKNDIITLIGI